MHIQIHSNSQVSRSGREKSPDFQLNGSKEEDSRSTLVAPDEDEHVLVLDFEESSKGQKVSNGYVDAVYFLLPITCCYFSLLSLPPALTPTATRKLIEKRNERFEQAVDEYAVISELSYTTDVHLHI
jgi:DEAD/DEAH box helicase domain-containing protein